MSNCVIIGGSGFIGTHLIKHILDTNLFDKVYDIGLTKCSIEDERVFYINADIKKIIIPDVKGCDVLFNLAAISKEPGYPYKDYFDTNFYGTLNILDFAKKNEINTIVFTSTMMVYGSSIDKVTESDNTYPDTAYGVSKLLAEKAHIVWLSQNPNRKLRIVRPSVVFGPGENGNYTRLFSLLKKNRFIYVGKKDTIKSSVYVKDIVKFLIYIYNNDKSTSTIYNFSYSEELTIEKINNTICDVFQIPRPKIVVPFRILYMISNFFKILNELGLYRTDIHPRRIEKLYYSTNILPKNALNEGYQFSYDFKSAIVDWQNENNGEGLF